MDWDRFGRRWRWLPAAPWVALFWLFVITLGNNFHATVPGELSRSAQLSPEALMRYSKQYGIRSVINLRGANPGAPWYDNEIRAANAAGIAHIDFTMSSKRALTKERAGTLLALMRDAPKPLLIHCRGGADRTGLAAALYLAGVKHRGTWESELQLTPLYGHWPMGYNHAMAMDASFRALEPSLRLPGS